MPTITSPSTSSRRLSVSFTSVSGTATTAVSSGPSGEATTRYAVDADGLAQRQPAGELGRRGDVLAVVEDDVAEHLAVAVAQLAVGARREPDPGAAAARRAAAAVRRLVVVADPALGERARDGAGAVARLLLGAVEQERALLRIGDAGERDQPDRRDGEHGGQQPRPQRAHHARGVRRA